MSRCATIGLMQPSKKDRYSIITSARARSVWEGRKGANIHAGLGFIWEIPDATCSRAFVLTCTRKLLEYEPWTRKRSLCSLVSFSQ